MIIHPTIDQQFILAIVPPNVTIPECWALTCNMFGLSIPHGLFPFDLHLNHNELMAVNSHKQPQPQRRLHHGHFHHANEVAEIDVALLIRRHSDPGGEVILSWWLDVYGSNISPKELLMQIYPAILRYPKSFFQPLSQYI